jgi:hypothetical protein
MDHSDGTQVFLSWSYVLSRVIHSIIQITVNNVSWRATIFGIGGLLLILMILKELLYFL